MEINRHQQHQQFIMSIFLLIFMTGFMSRGINSQDEEIVEESRTLDQIYRAALREGGRLIVYAGGDTAGQQDRTKQAFEKRFPGMRADIVVDYSKVHGPRIDYQLATGTLVPDVVTLQTLQDFPRWKAQGVLMAYKPVGWSAIYPDYRDPDGAHMGTMVLAFSTNVNTRLVPNVSEWPREANDFLREQFAGKLALTYPNDDDAVLFWFKQVVDKYGWQYMARFASLHMDSIFVRGTQAPPEFVGNGSAWATMTSAGALIQAPGASMIFLIPRRDPFTIWAQQAAIFKQTKRPEAAKLYMNWQLSKEFQESAFQWPVRMDVAAPRGYLNSWEYSAQSSHRAFVAFMEDRAGVERFKQQIGLFLGEPQGPSSNGYPGIYPSKALPH